MSDFSLVLRRAGCLGVVVVLAAGLAGGARADSGGISARSGRQGSSCTSCHSGGLAPEVSLRGPSEIPAGEQQWVAPDEGGEVTIFAAGNSADLSGDTSGDLSATTTHVVSVLLSCPDEDDGRICDDGNGCTDDACEAGACVRTANELPCDDGDPCTFGEVCADGACAPGRLRSCDDHNASPSPVAACVRRASTGLATRGRSTGTTRAAIAASSTGSARRAVPVRPVCPTARTRGRRSSVPTSAGAPIRGQ